MNVYNITNGIKSVISWITSNPLQATTATLNLMNPISMMTHIPTSISTTLKVLGNPILDKIWNGICEKIYSTVSIALYQILNITLIEQYSPNFNLFTDYFGPGFTETAFKFIRYSGLTIVACIMIWNLITISLGYIVETKDSFFQLLARFAITGLLICIAPFICEFGCNLTAAAFGEAYAIVKDVTNSDNIIADATTGTLNCINSTIPLDESTVNALTSNNTLNTFSTSLESSLPSITIFLQAILIICVCIELFKCAIEIIKRYVLSNLLWLLSPLAASAFASASTQPVFFSYIRMFNSQMILLVLNNFFIGGFILMITNKDAYTVLHLFTIIAWLQIANATEKYLSSIGLNAVTTGGALFNTIGGTVRTMMMAGMATSRAKTGIANGLVRIGTKTGDMSAVSSGLKLAGKGSGAGATLVAAVQHAGNEGLKYNNSLANSIASAHKAGQYSIASSAIGQINDPTQRKQAIKNLLTSTAIGSDGRNLLPSGITGNNMHKLEYNPNGSITWSSQLDMGDGSMKEANFRIDSNSNGKSVLSFEDLDGNTKFLHSDGIDGGLDVGDRIKFNADEEGISTLEAVGGIPINNLGETERSIVNGQLDSAEYLGGNEWTLLDENADRLASYNSNTGAFHLRGDSSKVTADVFQNTITKDSEGNSIKSQSLGQHLGFRNVSITSHDEHGFKFTAEEYSPKTGKYSSKKEYIATNLVTHNIPSGAGVKKLDLGSAGYYGIQREEILGADQKTVQLDVRHRNGNRKNKYQ